MTPPLDLDRHFPRYTDFDPAVPAWCLTPDIDRCLHRFFDTSPLSPSLRHAAVLRLPFEDRLPEPGEPAEVVLVDLQSGGHRTIARTHAWEPQLGAHINWADDQTLVFNDLVPGEWEPFAVRLDIRAGQSTRLGGPVYQLSPDGKTAASACIKRMRWTQAGYGAVIPDEHVPTNVGLRDDDGLYLTDVASGAPKLAVSLREFVDAAGPEELRREPEAYQIHGFHTKWSPTGDRLIFTIRWFGRGQRELRRDSLTRGLRFAVYTLRPDGSEIQLALGPEKWEKGGHHINFYPDGQALSMNLALFGSMQLVRCNIDGSDLRPILTNLPGSGHPSVHPDGRHILTDVYAHEPLAYPDGTVPMRWIDVESASERAILRFGCRTLAKSPTLRLDPHPAWDRTWRYITFNAFVGGTRRVYVADMQGLLKQRA